jgi:dipeptidyl aminopeptidase/acylaminoacyl peptidase
MYYAGLTGPEVAITEPGTRNQSLQFSKDGRFVVWSRVSRGDPNYDIVTMRVGEPASRRVVLEGTGAVAPSDVSDDGRFALVRKGISATSAELHLLDLTTGRMTEINPREEEVAYGAGEFTPDGRRIVTTSDEGSDFAQLVEIDLGTGRRTVLTPGLKWDVDGFDLSDDGRVLAYSVNEDGYSRVHLMDFRTRRPIAGPTLPTGVLTGLEFDESGRKLAIGLSTPTSSGDVWSWNLQTRRLERWTHSELGGLEPAAMVEPELIRYRTFDGKQIPAFVYKPRNMVGRRLPVIIDIHGGPEGQSRPSFSPGRQYWVNELGAAVITPNVRGSEGYGKTWIKLDNAEKREDSVKDIGALLDWIATQPDLDPQRVVVYGGSYGGYMVLASMTHFNDRLAGGVDIVGISNFISFLTNTEGYRRDLRRVEYGDERKPEMRAVFERISPLNNMQRVTKPLLVIQGANDPRVPKSEADQVVAKVRANGGDVWYLLARDEGHGFAKKQNRDAQREVETLFFRRVFGLTPGATAAR